MEDNNLKDRMDNTWQTPFYLINKGFLTSIIPLFHCIFPPLAGKYKPPVLRVVGDSERYYGKRYKSGAQENDCICIN